MTLLERYRRLLEFSPMRSGNKIGGLNTKLALWVIPPVVGILLVTGYITYRVSYRFINVALERSVKLQTRAMAHDIELFLSQCRRDLLYFAQNSGGPHDLAANLARIRQSGGIEYRSAGVIEQSGSAHRFWVAEGGRIVQIPESVIAQLRPDPFLLLDRFKSLTPGQVWVSPVVEAEYHYPTPENPNRRISVHVIQMATPVWGGDGDSRRYVLLAVDAARVRNILSIYNSSLSPIWSFPRTPEVRYSYLFDLDGWILFQSEEPENTEAALSTYLARSGLEGTLGRPGLPGAFRPAGRYGYFWNMVREVREGRFGVKKPNDPGELPMGQKEYYLAFSPILFDGAPGEPPRVVAGLAYVDVSRLTLAAGYKQVDAIFVLTVCSALIVALLIFFLGRNVTRPMLRLARAVQSVERTGRLEPIMLPDGGREVNLLLEAVNRMIVTLRAQMEEIRLKDKAIASATMKEGAWEMASVPAIETDADDPVPQLVGSGPQFERLKTQILKAAQVDVDVLILGETGTGKQLTAEAIHRLSGRAGGPFIAINCGALDENLLLDTLFGHCRGAFTEARTDRKGAFLEAHGGTLFLDEIQAASPRVQQALLRALAARCISPLGSDREVPVDVRIVAASNADLAELIAADHFREDLYFRLKVITLHTLPLRRHKEDIQRLARHFLKDALEIHANGQEMVLSRGALDRMQRYGWPGNVRELKHCLVRAAVMAESKVIQAEDLHLDPAAFEPEESDDGCRLETLWGDRSNGKRTVPLADPSGNGTRAPDADPQLNARQRRALPEIVRQGQTSRTDYQRLAGGVPPRTAVYDLKDLVEKGLLVRVGKGPATRYLPPGGDGDPPGGAAEQGATP